MANATRDGSKSQAIRDYLNSNPGATVRDVVEALAAQGVVVSVSLVNNVRARMRSAGGRKAGRGGKTVRVKKRAGRAGKINTSEKIREYLEENPRATPTQIVKALSERGIEVSHALASMVKYDGGKNKKKGAKKKRRVRRGRPAAIAVQRTGGPVSARDLSARDLFEAKKLVDRLGGADMVRQALEALDQLR